MKGYLYNHKGKVVVNPRLMPTPLRKNEQVEGHIEYIGNYQALANWESNNIEVENVFHSCEDGRDYINRTYGMNNNFYTGWKKVSFPIECLYTVNEKATINKLI